jgi:hypothetical protein
LSSVYKLHVHRWAEQVGCNVLILSQVQTIAVGSGRVYRLMEWVRKGEFDRLLPAPPSAADWLPLYEDHRRITRGVADRFPELLGSGPEAQAKIDWTRAFSTWARTYAAGFEEWLEQQGRHKLNRWVRAGLRLGHRQYKRHLEAMRYDLAGGMVEDADDFGASVKQSPELYFYLRVVLPCFCVYRKYPAMLLRRARRANKPEFQAEAIESLIRIDRYAVADAAIERWINGHDDGMTRRIRQEQVEQWKATGINGRYSKMQVYESMGGLILAMVRRFGAYWSFGKIGLQPGSITAAQVRDLFFAVEAERRKLGAISDGDSTLPNGFDDMELESWRKAVTRHAKCWDQLLKTMGGQKSP